MFFFILKDPVRSFWISPLDCWRIFGVFLSRKDFVFFFSNIFWIFKQGSFFFLSWLIFLICIFFSSPGWKAGDHGPWIHLRCSLPVCVVWGGGAFCSFQAPPPWSRRWKWRWTVGCYWYPGQRWRHQLCGPVRPSCLGWCSLWRCWCSPAPRWQPEFPPPSVPPTTSTTSTTSMVLCPLPSTGCPFLHVGAMVRSLFIDFSGTDGLMIDQLCWATRESTCVIWEEWQWDQWELIFFKGLICGGNEF